ncbi:hypothetical protein [Parabacteroides provencensis]|uniref:hypothetical protein n=1 Tax=Parabacteroides provencensis TaxID=1944636 RepID=UPI000C1479C3|nr:hypothetical protein [Parabacteroides provencensis]
MGHKSYHEHLIEEKENALYALNKVKTLENNKVSIYLKDNCHTIILVERSKLKDKIRKLEKQGKIIKRIL